MEKNDKKHIPYIAISRETTLLNKTDWGTQIPIIDQEKCSKCGICKTYCPEPAIFISDTGQYEINYDYCKGCGICIEECPLKIISAKGGD